MLALVLVLTWNHLEAAEAYHDPAVRSMASAVSVEFLDGTKSDEVVIEYPLGNPKHPGTQEAVKEKVIKNLSLTYDKFTVDKAISMIESQTDVEVTTLFEALWKVCED